MDCRRLPDHLNLLSGGLTNMKPLSFFLAGYAAFFFFAHALAAQEQTDETYYKQQALQAIEAFQKALKSELMQAMGQGGPMAAISVCNEQAPGIAAATANTYGLQIGRTSLKIRNPDNAPAEWEQSTLDSFETRKAAGEPLDALEAVAYDGDTYRYMKAIPMQGLCMTCHGPNLNPKLHERINSHYPKDQATGFHPGDIRGAFTVTMPLQQPNQKTEEN